jgi:hypothetical protein
MDSDGFRNLLDAPGPFASVYFEDSHAQGRRSGDRGIRDPQLRTDEAARKNCAQSLTA